MAKASQKGVTKIGTSGRGLESNAIESPEKMWEYFQEYIKQVKDNPILVHDFVGKDGESVYREKNRPLTIEGFEVYLFEKKIIGDLSHYFANTAGRYDRFQDIMRKIRMVVRDNQISGGLAGVFNANITARLNGLKEQTEIDHGVKSDVESMSFEIKRREK
jgi:hypothetical protein